MAQAAVTGALSAALTIVAVVVPFAGGLSLLVAVPMGLLGYRYRLRVLLAAAFAAATVAFLVAGISGFMVVLNCAYVGGLTGIIKRRGRGTLTVVAVSIIAGIVNGLWIVGVLMVLTRLRTLTFDALTANVEGLLHALTSAPVIGEFYQEPAETIRHWFGLALENWPLLIMGYSIFTLMVVSLVGWWVLGRVLERLRGIPDVHKLDVLDETGPIAPVPVTLRQASFRYPGAHHDALRPLDLTVGAGEHVAIVGANASGKTTLMLLLCGRPPSSGSVERPGAVGLGEIGGTAVVMQHPESHVLGSRVADDVVWGLPPGIQIDVSGLLDEVGLTGMEERDTGGLSGGELQRLAVAAALARQPGLLIADEVTTMVDQRGRDALLGVLNGLTERHRMALVHITHYSSEAEMADRTVTLSGSVDNTVMVDDAATAPRDEVLTPVPRSGRPVLRLNGVSHVYADGTPWAKPALRDITVSIDQGDGVLIHGGNGSGKSTLAWIMAGLIEPTAGDCLVEGKPASECVGEVAIAFQAARLQLLRSRVDREIASAAGFSHHDTARVAAALAAVGLDGSLAGRPVDQLSGGQMRRVVIAGLLARNPKALILDEPLAGLDAASQRGLLRLLIDLRLNSGLTVIVISHDFDGLEDLCPRTVHLDNGVLRPASTAAAGWS
jgi:energy-coupling factor transporter ATP-binding protein EcfA2